MKLPIDHCFDYQYLTHELSAYRSVRNKIASMIHAGEIVQLRKGLYCVPRHRGGMVTGEQVANLLYGPSYLSLEWALSYWSILPERVTHYTSVTLGKKKEWNNNLGIFTYKTIPQSAYSHGVSFMPQGGVLLASAEKALCDTLFQIKGLVSYRSLEELLFEDLRIDASVLQDLEKGLLLDYSAKYRARTLQLFHRWVLKNF